MRSMRRSDRQVSQAEAWEILDQADFCTLSMLGAEGMPYGVNLSFVRIGERIYFHSAKEGYKVDSLAAHPHVCLTAVASQHTLPEALSVAYRSVVAFGAARLVNDPVERQQGLEALCRKYAPNEPGAIPQAASCQAAGVWRIDLNEITGKAQVD